MKSKPFIHRPWKICLLAVLLAGGAAMAHRPVVIDGGYTDAGSAHLIPDPDVSSVGYHEATSSAPELWFQFDGRAGDSLYVQAGVPLIERYRELRPEIVLLGPGMAPVEVPFRIPAGYGGMRFSMESVEPVIFDEEFTGTESWQFPASEPELPADGRYYLVCYLPEDETGRYWMAVGQAEKFTIGDIITLPVILYKVRTFHEIFPFGGILGWAWLVLMLIAGLIAALPFVFF
jgi:hypothetical protein